LRIDLLWTLIGEREEVTQEPQDSGKEDPLAPAPNKVKQL